MPALLVHLQQNPQDSAAADALVKILNPMQERRKKYEENPRLAWDILEAGSTRAREVAGTTMDEVREAMGLDYSSNDSPNDSPNSGPAKDSTK